MANNPKHTDNLKNFPKGQSGNPAGRPPISELKEILFEEIGDEGIREIIHALHKSAIKGNTRAIEILFDRLYGKAKETIKIDQQLTVDDAREYLMRKLTEIAERKD